jgi:hypothetical protein
MPGGEVTVGGDVGSVDGRIGGSWSGGGCSLCSAGGPFWVGGGGPDVIGAVGAGGNAPGSGAAESMAGGVLLTAVGA